MTVPNRNKSKDEKLNCLVNVVGKIMLMLQCNKISVNYMVGETRTSGQPH